jgi:hypothetical protein
VSGDAGAAAEGGAPIVTWVQVEAAPVGGPGGTMKKLTSVRDHLNDFIVYLLTGYNVGPLGWSMYSDDRPCEVFAEERSRAKRGGSSSAS